MQRKQGRVKTNRITLNTRVDADLHEWLKDHPCRVQVINDAIRTEYYKTMGIKKTKIERLIDVAKDVAFNSMLEQWHTPNPYVCAQFSMYGSTIMITIDEYDTEVIIDSGNDKCRDNIAKKIELNLPTWEQIEDYVKSK